MLSDFSNSQFQCDNCGKCCQNLHANPLFAALHDGSGVCKHYDAESRLCRVYEKRPVFCNVLQGYSLFENKMSLKEYFQMNYEFCKVLKKM